MSLMINHFRELAVRLVRNISNWRYIRLVSYLEPRSVLIHIVLFLFDDA